MRTLTVIPSMLVRQCELCQHQDAMPDSKLCEVCGEAITRLVWIRERSCTQDVDQVEQPRGPNHESVFAYAFTRR